MQSGGADIRQFVWFLPKASKSSDNTVDIDRCHFPSQGCANTTQKGVMVNKYNCSEQTVSGMASDGDEEVVFKGSIEGDKRQNSVNAPLIASGDEDINVGRIDNRPVSTDTGAGRHPQPSNPNTNSEWQNMEIQQELTQIALDEEAVKSLQMKVSSLQEGSMERILMEMQLDTKVENIKTRKLMCHMMSHNKKLETEVSSVKEGNVTINNKLFNCESSLNTNTATITTMNTEVNKLKNDVTVLTGIVQQYVMMTEHLQS